MTPIIGPANGGSAVVPLNIAKEQARRNHQVTILTSNFQFSQEIINSMDGVNIESFELSTPFRSIYYTPKMRDWLELHGREYDLIHLHNFRSYQSIIVNKFAKENGIPYILHAHGSAEIVGGKNTFKKVFDMLWGRKIIIEASAYIAVSMMEVEHYVKLGAISSKVHIIPNALSASGNEIKPVYGMFRKELGIGANDKLIIFVGRLNKIKGIDVLIKAFSQLHHEKMDLTLAIIGPDDGEGSNLKKMVKSLGLENRVYFVGFVKDPASAYTDADILVYPSRYEIFGLVPFEAILYGTPVAVSLETGCGSMISAIGCGLTFPSGDELALADSIRFILNHPSEVNQMVRRGNTFILEKLTPEKVIVQMEDVYCTVVKDGGW